MQSIVHKDQTCGVVGRSIFSSFQLIRDMLDLIDKTNETGILVTLDQEKSFDRVDHDFLMRVLFKFGFGRLFAGGLFCSIRMFFLVLFATEVCQCRFFLEGKGDKVVLSPPFYTFWSAKS